EALGPMLPRADVVLQATSVGLEAPGDSPLPPGCVLHDRLTVMDMVYRPLRTRLLRDADAAGSRTIDGLWMLVFQGLAQLRLWTGAERADDAPPAPGAHRGRESRPGAPRHPRGPARRPAAHRGAHRPRSRPPAEGVWPGWAHA